MFGTPDIDGDAIPGIWVLRSDGTLNVCTPPRTDTGAGTQIATGWQNKMAIG
ncbi:hypothetical protein ACIP4W_23390 [Streptomyces sp. NPDC088846]|uniref:hypothetical protein n=1 Tax=Streptomyces sp. NPDC088846 TaxID=3365908 RepID=UPI00380015AF